MIISERIFQISNLSADKIMDICRVLDITPAEMNGDRVIGISGTVSEFVADLKKMS